MGGNGQKDPSPSVTGPIHLDADVILAGLADALSVQDENLTVLFQNEVGIAWFGDQRGKKCFEAYACGKGPCLQCPVLESLSSDQCVRREVHLKHDRTPRWVDVVASPFRDPNSGSALVLEVLRDVTAQKESERIVLESEARYRRIFHNIQDVYIETAMDGTVLEISPQVEELFGGRHKREDIIGTSILDFYEDREARGRFLSALGESGRIEDYEIVLKPPHGEPVACSISARLERTSQGKSGKVVGTLRDISARRLAEQSAKETALRLGTLINASPDFICFKDGQGRWLEVNKAGAELFCLEGVPCQGKTDAELASATHPIYREAFLGCSQSDEVAWSQSQPSRGEEVIPLPQGGERYFDVIKVPILSVDGKREALIVLGRDITHRKRAEEAVRESEERFRLLFQRAPIAYQSLDREGRILEVNQQWLDLLGYSREEVVGRWIGDFLAADSISRLQTNFPRFISAGEVVGAEFEFLRKSGESVLVSVNGKIGRSSEGQFQQTHCTLNDITQQRKAEDALRSSEEKYRRFIDATSDLVFLKDESFRYLLTNPAMRAFQGRPKDDLVGLTEFDLLPAAVAERCRATDQEALDRGSVTLFEEIIGERVFQTTKFPVPLPGGRIGLGGYIRDVTERKQAEAVIEQSRNELKAIYEHAPVMMCLLDGGGRVRYANRAFVEFAGKPEETLVGGRPGDVLGCIRANEDPRGCNFGEDCKSCTLRRALEDTIKTGEAHRSVEYQTTAVLAGVQQQITLLASTAFVSTSGQNSVLICLNDITKRKRAEDALRESEALFRTTADHAPVLIWIAGLDKGCTYFNRPWLDFTGHSIEEELGDGWAQSVHPEDLDACATTYSDAFDQRRSFDLEYRLRRHDGQYRWVLDRGIPRFTPEGTFLGYIGAAHDITDRKNTELAILRRDAVLSAVAFASESLLRSSNWESSIQEVLARLGRAGAASRAYVFQRHAGSSDTPCVSQRYEWVADSADSRIGNPALQNIPLSFDGFSRWRDCLISGQPIVGAVRDFPETEKAFLERLGVSSLACIPIFVRGEAWGFIGFDDCVQDRTWDTVEIEAFKAAAAVIGSAIQRQASSLGLVRRQEAMQVVNRLAMTPGKGIVELCREVTISIAGILGVPHAKVKSLDGEAWTVLAEWENGRIAEMADTPLGECPCWEIWRTGRPYQRQGILRDVYCQSPYFPEGAPRSFLGVPILGGKNEVRGTLSVICAGARRWDEDEIHVLDIFARYISYELEKARLDNQLHQDQGMKVLGQLAAGVSHEVRNPLNAILGLTDVLAQDLSRDPEYQEIFTHIRLQVDRLSNLMRDLLELGKPIEPAKMNSVRVDKLLESAVMLFVESPEGRDHPVDVVADKTGGGCYVIGDGTKLQQAFLNLLGNAADHSPAGCPIRVEVVSSSPPWLCLRFVDQGSGIPQENLSRLFEPFFTTRKGGTGLGLSIVRHLIEAHGGSVLIRNNADQRGATVEVKLPSAQVRVNHEA
jgi:PAS domain S-box-containing protein